MEYHSVMSSDTQTLGYVYRAVTTRAKNKVVHQKEFADKLASRTLQNAFGEKCLPT